MKYVGWTAAAIVLIGILTAWMEPPSTGLVHAAALALASFFSLYAIARRHAIPVHWIAILPLACAAWGIVQIAVNWTVYPFETWNSASAWLARAVIFSAAYAGFQDQRARERLKSIAVWFGGAFSLLALLQWYSDPGKEIAGTFGNRNHYAAFIELLLPIAFAEAIRNKRFPAVPAACAGLMFASVVACGSRAGAAIVSIEALVFLVAASVGSRRNYRAAGLIVASLAVCTVIGGWNYVWERFVAGDPFAYRREMLTATVHMIGARPLTGFGLGAWPSVYQAFAVFDPPGIYMNHAHNDWAEWTADGGLPFLGILAVFAGATALRVRRNLWAVGIFAVLAHALVDFPLHKPALACAVFLMAGVVVAASAKSVRDGERSINHACRPGRRDPRRAILICFSLAALRSGKAVISFVLRKDIFDEWTQDVPARRSPESTKSFARPGWTRARDVPHTSIRRNDQ